MNCERIEQLYTNYYEDELPNDLREQVTHHLQVCSQCRTSYERFQRVMSLLSEPTPDLEAPSFLRNRILAEVSRQPSPNRLSWLYGLLGLGPADTGAGKRALALGVTALAIMSVIVLKQSPLIKRAVEPATFGLSISAAPQSGIEHRDAVLQSVSLDQTAQKLSLTVFSSLILNSDSIETYDLTNSTLPKSTDPALTNSATAPLLSRNNKPGTDNSTISAPLPAQTQAQGRALCICVQSVDLASNAVNSRDYAYVSLSDQPSIQANNIVTDWRQTVESYVIAHNTPVILTQSAVDQLSKSGFQHSGALDVNASLSDVLAQVTSVTETRSPQGSWVVSAK